MHSFWLYTHSGYTLEKLKTTTTKNPNCPDPTPNPLKATTPQVKVVSAMYGILVFQDGVEGKHGVTAELKASPFIFYGFD